MPIIEENASIAETSRLPMIISPNNPAQMPTEEADGYSYIGVLSIPSRDISLPVMATWDYGKLTKAPCRYSGSYYTGDLVICAHNYTRHFFPMINMDIGTEVCLLTVDGVVLRYVVSNRETVQPTACDQMIDSDADWDLTLFTCNLGGQTRCAVRCLLVADQPVTEWRATVVRSAVQCLLAM